MTGIGLSICGLSCLHAINVKPIHVLQGVQRVTSKKENKVDQIGHAFEIEGVQDGWRSEARRPRSSSITSQDLMYLSSSSGFYFSINFS